MVFPNMVFSPEDKSASMERGELSASAQHVENAWDQVDEPSHLRAVNNRQGWLAEPVAPWRRYGARILDVVISGTLGFIVFALAFGIVAPLSAESFFLLFEGPGGRFLDLFCSLIMAGFVNAILMGTIGTTLGKAIFGIRILLPNDEKIGLAASFHREAKVWFFGLGAGIPILSFITILISYRRLKERGQTTWDEGQYNVLYRQAGGFQTSMNIIGILLIILARIAFQYLE
jgi:uncharacterized RDD family membrane protein YckC